MIDTITIEFYDVENPAFYEVVHNINVGSIDYYECEILATTETIEEAYLIANELVDELAIKEPLKELAHS